MAYGTEQAGVREKRARLNNVRAWANAQAAVSTADIGELLRLDQDASATRKGRAMGVSRAVLAFAVDTVGRYGVKLDHIQPDVNGQLHGWVIDSDLASRIRSYDAARSLGWRQTIQDPDGIPRLARDPSLELPRASFVYTYMPDTLVPTDRVGESGIVSLRDVFKSDMLVTRLSEYTDPVGATTDRYHGLPLGFAVRSLVEMALES